MKRNLTPVRLVVTTILIAAFSVLLLPAHAQNSKDQLDKASNTGSLFDGSDGKRFGTDTKIDTSGSTPEVPPPTAVNTSSGTAGGYSVGGSTTTTKESSGNSGKDTDSSQKKDAGSDKGKTGSEPAR